jgi:hypothetical protein
MKTLFDRHRDTAYTHYTDHVAGVSPFCNFVAQPFPPSSASANSRADTLRIVFMSVFVVPVRLAFITAFLFMAYLVASVTLLCIDVYTDEPMRRLHRCAHS